MHGWEELTDRVESVVATLPQAEREDLVIFASNYGEAGAIEYFGRDRGLPPVASSSSASAASAGRWSAKVSNVSSVAFLTSLSHSAGTP